MPSTKQSTAAPASRREKKNRGQKFWLFPGIPLLGILVVMALGLLAANQVKSPKEVAVVPVLPTPTPDAQRQALMENLSAQTRHWKGDPAAPVTILEYSDFQ